MNTKNNDETHVMRLHDRIDTALLENRRLFICDGIDNALAKDLIKKLWFLEIENPGKPITLFINSPGGSVDAGFAIWDQIKMITSPVTTIVTGMAASMATVLMLVAEPKRRFATPTSRIMIHQPAISGVIQGQATDLEIQAKEMLKTKKMIIQFYVDATGKSYEAIEKSIDRDTWMTAQEAISFGLIHKTISSYRDL